MAILAAKYGLTSNPAPGGDTPASDTAYILGSDVIAQATGTNDPVYQLYDGHGSVRHLANNAGALISGQTFDYDAYGNLLGAVTPQTGLLYSGEMLDNNLQQYYLRARWYNPANGRFNRMDPFAGNNRDPQSLHKYLYAYGNSINRTDPSGNFALNTTGLVLNMAMNNLLTGDFAARVVDPKDVDLPKAMDSFYFYGVNKLIDKGKEALLSIAYNMYEGFERGGWISEPNWDWEYVIHESIRGLVSRIPAKWLEAVKPLNAVAWYHCHGMFGFTMGLLDDEFIGGDVNFSNKHQVDGFLLTSDGEMIHYSHVTEVSDTVGYVPLP